jgi:hypothetical protein|uniref:Uncharacterized protein n=1 Tax=Eutreptiella gymnastica TaxID=73025 RepID=A0A7S4CHZ4_9EUGL|eukprot:CAMPEP_0174290480 /NCGR_PEP_ID=MMETSP0809-20121228/29022_1 /TAXON_ID=73025 ORGANISM="Eutreptiella gymnastica-like, Strain CCMP1594" /NCGR_SAMPLE_ID=MMETSP0809 /ASSEMBLY_ACC=CAM_ASM_000658 /LENGTH=105 /DNA_ID=CAMNT_0015389165 /DNA_START=94 /DNA_END=411 /DNA_ORIENTATION=+
MAAVSEEPQQAPEVPAEEPAEEPAEQWSIYNTAKIERDDRFDIYKYDFSETAKNSVTEAVTVLNKGEIHWSHDYAVVYSNRERCYFVLAKVGLKPCLAAVQEQAE